MGTHNTQESLYPFPDDIFIQKRSSAIEYGTAIFEQGIIERCLVMWVDASVEVYPRVKRVNRLSAAAVRYLDLSSKGWMEFVTLKTLQYGSNYSLEAEFVAIHEALRFASGLTDDFDRLLIFSDCKGILQGIKAKSPFISLSKTDLVNSLFFYANSLYDLGITVELRWVPSHSSVEGNERVDKLAKRTRRSAQSILAQESPNFILDYVTVAPGSIESLRQALFEKITLGIQNEKSYDDRTMEEAISNSKDKKPKHLLTPYTIPLGKSLQSSRLKRDICQNSGTAGNN